jgi:virginiamycin A acetyltransferase
LAKIRDVLAAKISIAARRGTLKISSASYVVWKQYLSFCFYVFAIKQVRGSTLSHTANPSVIFPVANVRTVTYARPTVKNKSIIVGDFTYFSDVDFENHVTHHYDFYGDRLIIGKFCQIGKGVEFIMNGANHQMNAVSTYPFYIFHGWNQKVPPLEEMPIKGDTVIGNDVWFGQNVTILPGVHIESGSIVGANSVVGSNIEAYSVAVGNPARIIRKRFDDELIEIMLSLRWWDRSVEEIDKLIPLLTNHNLTFVKKKLKEFMTSSATAR